jgi:hypothetical protein
MKVRSTDDRSLSQSANATFSTVSVGKTQTQIISASWCLLGGGTFRGRLSLLRVMLNTS